MPFYRVQAVGDPVQSGNVIQPYPTKPNEIPLFFIPDISGNGLQYLDTIDRIRELDGYQLDFHRPNLPAEMEPHKIYLYVNHSKELEYAVKDSSNGIDRTIIPNVGDITEHYNSILANLSSVTRELTPEQEKAIYDITSRKGFAQSTRPIFVYIDPIIAPDKKRTHKENTSLQDQAKLIAECMVQDCLPPGPAPYLLVGYSYGCDLAALAAQQLKRQGLNTSLFSIDGPSPECTQAYFSSNSEQLRADIVKIVKYVAQLSMQNFDNMDHDGLADLVLTPGVNCASPLQAVDEVANLIRAQEKGLDLAKFDKYLTIVKQSIKNLIHYQAQDTPPKIDKIVSLITKNTEAKYGNSYGGWDGYTEKLSVIYDDTLRSREHIALLQESEAGDALASYIVRFLRQATKPGVLLSYILDHARKTLVSQMQSLSNPTLFNLSLAEDANLKAPYDPANVDNANMTVIESFSDDEANDETEKVDAHAFVNQLEVQKRFVMTGLGLFKAPIPVAGKAGDAAKPFPRGLATDPLNPIRGISPSRA